MYKSELPHQPDQPRKERELSPEAKEIINLFQKAKQTTDEKEQFALLKEFHEKLVLTLAGRKNPMQTSEEFVKKVVLDGLDPHYLGVGGRTGGQRIFFQRSMTIYDIYDKERVKERVERFGKNAKKDIYRDNEIVIESTDGKPRWMWYPKPEGNDWKFGGEYWQKYIEVFNDELVDLLQEFQDK